MSSPAAALHGIGKRYAPWSAWVLTDVDLELAPGTLTTVTGANGTGKSTLLRVASGASQPTRGRVERTGRAALVPERLPARLGMTATTYLAHMARLHGLPAGAARARGAEVLHRLGLSPGAAVPIRTLSKGNSQKVALAQALLGPVDLLVLDEPFSGLDGAARVELAGLLDEARSNGAAVLASSHQTDHAMTADQSFTISGGRLS